MEFSEPHAVVKSATTREIICKMCYGPKFKATYKDYFDVDASDDTRLMLAYTMSSNGMRYIVNGVGDIYSLEHGGRVDHSEKLGASVRLLHGDM